MITQFLSSQVQHLSKCVCIIIYIYFGWNVSIFWSVCVCVEAKGMEWREKFVSWNEIKLTSNESPLDVLTAAYDLSSDAIRVHIHTITHPYAPHTKGKKNYRKSVCRAVAEAMHTHNREIYLDQGNKLLTQTFCVLNAHILSEFGHQYHRTATATMTATTASRNVVHFKRTRDLMYHESEISSAQLNRTFVPLARLAVTLFQFLCVSLLAHSFCWFYTQCAHRTPTQHIDSFFVRLCMCVCTVVIAAVHFI